MAASAFLAFVIADALIDPFEVVARHFLGKAGLVRAKADKIAHANFFMKRPCFVRSPDGKLYASTNSRIGALFAIRRGARPYPRSRPQRGGQGAVSSRPGPRFPALALRANTHISSPRRCGA
jgi:hypothetical protein